MIDIYIYVDYNYKCNYNNHNNNRKRHTKQAMLVGAQVSIASFENSVSYILSHIADQVKKNLGGQ